MVQIVLEGLPITLLAFGYLVRARTLARAGRPVALWRQVVFAAGLVVVWIAIASPLAPLAEDLQTWHMVQHILLGDIAAVLIVLGLTGPLLQPLLGARGLRHLRVLALPVVAFVLWVVSLYTWHLPFLYEAAVEHPVIHAAEHASFLSAGIAMWAAVLGPLAKPAWFTGVPQLAYVFVMRITGALLANVLIWSSAVFYPSYEISAVERGWDPMTDQNLSGAVLMIEGSVITIIVFAWLFMRWARHEQQQQDLLDRAEEAGIELDAARVRRAVASGHGDWLEQRIQRQIDANRPGRA